MSRASGARPPRLAARARRHRARTAPAARSGGDLAAAAAADASDVFVGGVLRRCGSRVVSMTDMGAKGCATSASAVCRTARHQGYPFARRTNCAHWECRILLGLAPSSRRSVSLPSSMRSWTRASGTTRGACEVGSVVPLPFRALRSPHSIIALRCAAQPLALEPCRCVGRRGGGLGLSFCESRVDPWVYV